jgi:hypothetical protein
MTGHARAALDHACVPPSTRSVSPLQHWRRAPTCSIRSSKGPEPVFTDQMHQIIGDQTCPASAPPQPCSAACVSVCQQRPDSPPSCLVACLHQSSVRTRGHALLCHIDRTHLASIWSQRSQSPVDQKLLPLTSNFATLDQMCQPPSASPCAHVLAYFHTYF